MPTPIDVEHALLAMDDASQRWLHKFQTSTEESIEAIWELVRDSSQCVILLSKPAETANQAKQNQISVERIVLKMKELRNALDPVWPTCVDSFVRETFNVGRYSLEAVQFFDPVPFYPGSDRLSKMYRWSVYDSRGTAAYRYYLERIEVRSDKPYYVLGKFFAHGHSQIQPYGRREPDYNRIRTDVIRNLQGDDPPPMISLAISSSML